MIVTSTLGFYFTTVTVLSLTHFSSLYLGLLRMLYLLLFRLLPSLDKVIYLYSVPYAHDPKFVSSPHLLPEHQEGTQLKKN